MIIHIDKRSVAKFVLTGRDDKTYRDVRNYYVAKQVTGRRMIIVCRNGLDLSSLAGKTIDGVLDWDDGTPGFVHEANVGRSHRKLTIYKASLKGTRATLARVLDMAPRT